MLTISRFTDIKLEKDRPLVLLDIDDTCITWKYGFRQILSEIGVSPDCVNVSAYQSLYDTYVTHNDAEATDIDGFNDLIKRVGEKNGKVCFLTARKPEHKDRTIQRLNAAGICGDKLHIYFAGSKILKGQFISEHMADDISQFGEVIFVDDSQTQLASVGSANKQVRLFKFVLGNLRFHQSSAKQNL